MLCNKMNKSNITLFIITILLIFILLHYRCICLQFNSPDNLIVNYSRLPRASLTNRVVINFTTTQEKIQNLKPFINSILDQTVKVDQIALNLLPKKYNIPEWYNDVLNIFRTGKDYGPGMNIIPALTREGENDTIIISISSDKLYEKTFIENMVNMSINNPNTAFIKDDAIAI